MKKFDDDLEFESLNDEPRDTRFILPIIVVAVLLCHCDCGNWFC